MDTQNRPPKPNRKIPDNSDWSNSENEKDIKLGLQFLKHLHQSPQPNTSFAQMQ